MLTARKMALPLPYGYIPIAQITQFLAGATKKLCLTLGARNVGPLLRFTRVFVRVYRVVDGTGQSLTRRGVDFLDEIVESP